MKLYSEQAEKNILGSILLDNAILEDCNLVVDDFYNPIHKDIFEAMLTVKEKGIAIDPISTIEAIKDKNIDIEFSYLAALISTVSATGNYKYHAKIIKERAAQRQLIKIAEEIKHTASKDLSEAIQQAVKDIQALQIEDEVNDGYVPDLIDKTIEKIKENNRKGHISGISTGFEELNKLTGGWQPGRYYILGARPKMGKTSLFCQIADKAAEEVPTVIFSLEMTKEELMKLLIYQNSKIDSMLEQSGKLTAKEFHEMKEAVSSLYEKPLYIDDKSRTIADIRASMKKIQKIFHNKGKGNIGLIVIDYVQLINGDKRLQRNYQLEEISRGLKEIAKDFNVCVLALSQLSREVETRKDKKPIPSDLRDSGSFEQDCDGLMLMYRDSYYNGQKSTNTVIYKYYKANVVADIVDINFFLNRHGPAGIFKLDFVTPFRRFFDHDGNNEILKPSYLSDFYYTDEQCPWDLEEGSNEPTNDNCIKEKV